MYITSIVFTLIAWGGWAASGCKYSFRWSARLFVLAGAAARFGLWDFACCGQLKRIKRDGDKWNRTRAIYAFERWKGKEFMKCPYCEKEMTLGYIQCGMACIGHWRSSLLHHFLLWAREALAFPMAQRIIPTPYLRSSAKIAKKSLLTIRMKGDG